MLKYLKGFVSLELCYSGHPLILEGYYDVNWISESDDIHSTNDFLFTLAGEVLSWKSSKQTCIAKSTIEFEFIALEMAGREAKWLRNLVADFPL